MYVYSLFLIFGIATFLQAVTSNSENEGDVSSESHKNILRLPRIPGFLSSSPSPVQILDVNKYLGNWYQIYGAPFDMIYQGYGKCITAEYKLLTNKNIGVLNSQINKNGVLEQISGYAYYRNSSEPGKLTVHLDGTPVDAPYWVVKLGETVNNQYQYSIVTTQLGYSLWVLVRNVDIYLENYDKEVKLFLDKYNYKYVSIIQDENCRKINIDYRLF